MAEEPTLQGLFGSSIDFFKGALKGTAGTAVGLGGALLTGQQKLSAYSGALANNTEAFGKLAGQVGKVVDGLTQFAEASLAEYQALTGIGATFNKEIKEIKVAAAELGLTVEEMTGFFKDNMKSLSAFGGSTDSAIAAFKTLSNTVLDSRELGTELRRLGYTTKDINEGLALYGELTDANSRADRLSVQEQAQSAKNLMVELDALAKLTGKQRDAIAEELKDKRRQGDINAFLSNQSAEAQQAFMDQYGKISAKLGKDAADAFADIAMRGTVTSETTQGALLAMGEGGEAFYEAASKFNAGDYEAFADSISNATSAAVDYQKTEEFRNTAVLGQLTGISSSYADASSAAYDYVNRLDSAGDDTMSAAEKEAQIRTEILDQQSRQMEQVTGIFDRTIDMQENLREISTSVMEQTIGKIEDVAIAAIDKVAAALPSADEIAAGINKGVGSLFDIADLTDRQDANVAQTKQTGSEIIDNATAIGADVVDSNVEGAKVTSETTTKVGEETQTVVTEEYTKTRKELVKAEENLMNATKLVSDMVEAGFQNQDPQLEAAKEAANLAAQEARDARMAVEGAARKQAYESMKSQGIANIGGKTYAEGGNILPGEIGIVGEAGPEFVTGPANVMSANTSMGVMQSLMRSLRAIDTSVQDVRNKSENSISTSQGSVNAITNDMSQKYDTMISLLSQLIQVENQAVGTQKKTMKATRGLTGNMLRGV